MAIVSGNGGGGRLNPWAEPFVPSGVRYRGLQTAAAEAEQEVEDFSPEWWRLVASSPAFRDRWLREYGALGLLDADEEAEVVDSFLPDDIFSPQPPRQGKAKPPSRSARPPPPSLEILVQYNLCCGADLSSILWRLRSAESEREESAAGKRGGAAGGLEVAAWGIDKWWRAHGGPPEAPRYAEKAPRRVAGGARVSPRPIQQPR
ncbi:unnamed protein product [Urochloa decumbens]|uniref:Uncharacterized protein n=1 Tax=Urochloa decumbens TaxID=240449 RepID=A0ABC8WCE3_9POAL